MRKTMFWSSLIATALLGSACKKDASEKAADEVRKSVEEVREQREDLRESQKDVAEEQKDVSEEQRDVAKQQRELAQAEGALAQARHNYTTAMRERLAKIDAKIRELDMRADAKAKDAAITLRARRDALSAKLDTAGSRVEAEWKEFKSDLDDTVDKLEKDINYHFDD